MGGNCGEMGQYVTPGTAYVQGGLADAQEGAITQLGCGVGVGVAAGPLQLQRGPETLCFVGQDDGQTS